MSASILTRMRYRVIEFLAKDMPIVMNVNICRPKGYRGALGSFDGNKPGMLHNLVFFDRQDDEAILTAKRDKKITEVMINELA